MQNKQLGTIFLILLVDIMGFGFILPLLPYYAKAYEANEIIIGLMVASFALMQFIGAPILGRWSDRIGRRPVLLVSIAGTALGFLILAIAEPLGLSLFGKTHLGSLAVLTLLFLSRILDGLTGGNISVAQAYITDVTDESTRAKGLGMVGAAFGIGFIIGPAFGGFLSNWGYTVPAYAAFAVALTNLVLVYLILPESLTAEKRAAMRAQVTSSFNLLSLWHSLSRPKVGALFKMRFFFVLGSGMFQNIFSLYAAGAPLSLNAQQTGYLLTYVGLLSAIIQGGIMGQLTKRFSEIQLALVSAALLTAALFGWALAQSVPSFMVVIAVYSFAASVLGTMISTLLTKSVEPFEVGQVLGMGASYDSLTRILSPTLGGWLLSQFGGSGPGLFSGILMACVAVYMWRNLTKTAT